jgi:hypothetical protein
MKSVVLGGSSLGKLLGAVAVVANLVGCTSTPTEEEQAAQAALTLWVERQPAQYTFVVVPENVHDNVSARIRVENERVVGVDPASSGANPYGRFTMTAAIQEALATAGDERRFQGAYDPLLGYLVWYDVPTADRNPDGGRPSYGVDVTCFEESSAPDACSRYFP